MTLEKAKEKILQQSGNLAIIDDEELYVAFIVGKVFGLGIKREDYKRHTFVVFMSDDGHYWPIHASRRGESSASLYWLEDLKDICFEAQQYCLKMGWKQG